MQCGTAAEAEVEVMTVEHNRTDLVFTPSSLSSAGHQTDRTHESDRGGGRGEEYKRKKNRDIKRVRG